MEVHSLTLGAVVHQADGVLVSSILINSSNVAAGDFVLQKKQAN